MKGFHCIFFDFSLKENYDIRYLLSRDPMQIHKLDILDKSVKVNGTRQTEKF